MTTGGTGPYTMTLTMPIINYDLVWDSCDLNCESQTKGEVDYFINPSSTATTNNITFTSTTSSKYTIPWGFTYIYSGSTSKPSFEGYGSYSIFEKLNENHPASGITNTLIPSLSSITCNSIYSKMVTASNANTLEQFAYYYKIELTDPLDVTSFRILARPIVNGGQIIPFSPLTFPDVAVIYTAGVLTYPNPIYTVP
jgi:hypothetical protein